MCPGTGTGTSVFYILLACARSLPLNHRQRRVIEHGRRLPDSRLSSAVYQNNRVVPLYSYSYIYL